MRRITVLLLLFYCLLTHVYSEQF